MTTDSMSAEGGFHRKSRSDSAQQSRCLNTLKPLYGFLEAKPLASLPPRRPHPAWRTHTKQGLSLVGPQAHITLRCLFPVPSPQSPAVLVGSHDSATLCKKGHIFPPVKRERDSFLHSKKPCQHSKEILSDRNHNLCLISQTQKCFPIC